MNGSKHSFYGTNTVAQVDKNNEGKSRAGKQAILLSKGSNKHISNSGKNKAKGKSQQPHGQQSTSIPRNKIPLGKNLNKLVDPKVNKRNNTEMNQTFSVADQNYQEAQKSTNLKEFRKSDQSEMAQTSQNYNKKNSEARRDSPSSIYRTRHRPSDAESQERIMTRNDSEYTPYFIPTPQRTESNWGDSAYHQTNNNGKEAQL